jgi:hypothetical protein
MKAVGVIKCLPFFDLSIEKRHSTWYIWNCLETKFTGGVFFSASHMHIHAANGLYAGEYTNGNGWKSRAYKKIIASGARARGIL